jgi:transcriptional regulator GlxA family with amidase domain
MTPEMGRGADMRILDVTIMMFDDGMPSTAVMPTEIFHYAGRLWNVINNEPQQVGFRVRTASLDGAAVRSPYGMIVQPEASIDQIECTDIVIVSTAGLDIDVKLSEHSRLLPWLQKQHQQGAYVVGICMGAAYLAAAGLLDGRAATTHWALAADFAHRWPRVKWQPELLVTEDTRALCSGGVGSAIDISLYLVEKFCGHTLALQTAKALLLPMPRLNQSSYAVLPVGKPHDNERIREAETYLQVNFRDDVSIAALAERLNMTERTFVRHFKAATGKLPAAYLQAVRIEAAKVMIEHGGLGLQAVAEAVGYCDIAFFRTLFKRATGMTPTQYRQCFAPIAVTGPAVLDDDTTRQLAYA